jgi:Icc-related predicted phosphoesterase
MKILAIGDPHGDIEKIRKIPKKDVDTIIITGDLGKANYARKFYFENIKRKQQGLEELEYDGKICRNVYKEIYDSTIKVLSYLAKNTPTYSFLGNVGNHIIKDSEVKKDEKKYNVKLPYLGKSIKKIDNFHLAVNVVRNINGLRVGFLEYFNDIFWDKEFGTKDKKKIKKAKKETDKAKKILKNFGSLDILVCHQPPYGYLDKVSGKWGAPKNYWGKHAGSKVILDYVKKYQPKYVFCGHIHEGEGKTKIGKSEVYNLGVAGHKIINL